jgi:hypothetical protein
MGVILVSHEDTSPEDPKPATTVSLNLETVHRLAEQNNRQVALARERVQESLLVSTLASQSHVPNIMRKDEFKRVQAEAKVWRDKTELARVLHETLQEAGGAYIDLLTARHGETVARDLEKLDQKVLERADALYNKGMEPGAAVLVSGAKTALQTRKETIVRLHQQGDAAAIKLIYLLGLDRQTPLAHQDQGLPAMDLVDLGAPLAG